MASRTINVTEEAYELLKSRKRDGESFTDVIKRLAGERPLSDLIGILTPRQAEALRRAVREGRAQRRAQHRRRVARQAEQIRRALRR